MTDAQRDEEQCPHEIVCISDYDGIGCSECDKEWENSIQFVDEVRKNAINAERKSVAREIFEELGNLLIRHYEFCFEDCKDFQKEFNDIQMKFLTVSDELPLSQSPKDGSTITNGPRHQGVHACDGSCLKRKEESE